MGETKYIVIEIQTMLDGTVANLVNVVTGRDNAASTFHSILAAAAISQLPCHAASWLNSDGSLVDWKTFYHDVQPEPIENESNEVIENPEPLPNEGV